MKKAKKRAGLSAQLRGARTTAERTLERSYDTALHLLPPRPRKAVQQVADRIGTTAEDVSARGRRALRTMEKQRQLLQDTLEHGVRRVRRRGAAVREAVETRSTRLVATIERRVASLVKPVARRLDLAAASEVAHLRKRLGQVERKLAASGRRAAA